VALTVLGALEELGLGEGHFGAELRAQLAALLPAARRNPHGSGALFAAILQSALGPIVVSGEGSGQACLHAHAYRKAGGKPGLQLCHAGTCREFRDSTELAAEVRRLVIV
jgi:hypothetical protein